MFCSGIAYVETDYEEGYSTCVLTVRQGKEYKMPVKFWKTDIPADTVVSYSGILQRDGEMVFINAKEYKVLPIGKDFISKTPFVMHLVVHGLCDGFEISSRFWNGISKEEDTYIVQIDCENPAIMKPGIMSVAGIVTDFNGKDFKMKFHSRQFCPRDQAHSEKSPSKPPKRTLLSVDF